MLAGVPSGAGQCRFVRVMGVLIFPGTPELCWYCVATKQQVTASGRRSCSAALAEAEMRTPVSGSVAVRVARGRQRLRFGRVIDPGCDAAAQPVTPTGLLGVAACRLSLSLASGKRMIYSIYA